MLYQCGVCGPVGKDDGRGIVTLIAVHKRVAHGTVLESRCAVRAPTDESVHARLVPVFEHWLRNRRTVGKSIVSRVAAGGVHLVILDV
jgi:hypothetical protein